MKQFTLLLLATSVLAAPLAGLDPALKAKVDKLELAAPSKVKLDVAAAAAKARLMPGAKGPVKPAPVDLSRRQEEDFDLTDALPFDLIPDEIPVDDDDESPLESGEDSAVPATVSDFAIPAEIEDADDSESQPIEEIPEEDESSLPEADEAEEETFEKRQDLIDDEDTDFASPDDVLADANEQTSFEEPAEAIHDLLSDVVDSVDGFVPSDENTLEEDSPIETPEAVPTKIADIAPIEEPVEDIVPATSDDEQLVPEVPSTEELPVEDELPVEEASDLLKREEDEDFNVEISPESNDIDAEESGDVLGDVNDEDLGEDDNGLLDGLLDTVTGEEDGDDF